VRREIRRNVPKRLADRAAFPDFEVPQDLYACAEESTDGVVEDQV